MIEKIESGLKDIVTIYTTCSSKEEIQALSISSLKEKLAVSVDYWTISSIYPWEGVIKEMTQFILMFSTQKGLSEKLINHIETMHPYSVPVITRCDTSKTNQLYNYWSEKFLLSKDEIFTEKEVKKNRRAHLFSLSKTHYGMNV